MQKMASRSRRNFPRVVIERDTDSEESSSAEEEAEQVDEVNAEEEGQVGYNGADDGGEARKGKRKPITISLKQVCKVCKEKGHEAGFKGATYIDCPKKPCFLCKQPGHTTMSCPHRIATEYGVVPAPRRYSLGTFDFVYERQLRNHIAMVKPTYVIPNQVDCAIIKLHSRRVTCLEFHPTKNNILISGDKKGQVAIWDYEKVYDKTVYDTIHSCIVNSIKFHPVKDGSIYTSGSDGTISYTDIETGVPILLMDLNPDGWNGPATWKMLYGMDINSEKDLVLVADNFGHLYQVDMRSNKKTGEPILVHKKGSKVVGLHCNPVHPDLLISCGNDHFDPSECLAVIGRYISDNFNGVALHPIDFIDISTGQLVAEVTDPNITTISPVNKLHPRSDVLASGSSRSLFIWRPKEQLNPEQTTKEESVKVSIYTVQDTRKGKGKFEDDDADDCDDFPLGKKLKSNVVSSKLVTCPDNSKSKPSKRKK